MYTQAIRNSMPSLDNDFNKPIESIMKCEDFKSNFARRLSNRYTSRSSVSLPTQNPGLQLQLPNRSDANYLPDEHIPESVEPTSQLSKSNYVKQNGEAVKPPDKLPMMDADIKRTQDTVLNMEVETLRWQLIQTEANRQMHIALLKQIVTFLNRVKQHIETKNNEINLKNGEMTSRLSPKSNSSDLPRSRSVVHMNKNIEYLSTMPKKNYSRKISKSISNVNAYREYNCMRSPSKLTLEPEDDTSKKLSEEILRLITLANTVMSTNLPDLACNDMESASLMPNSTIIHLSSSGLSHSPATTTIYTEKNTTLRQQEKTNNLADTKENFDGNKATLCEIPKKYSELKSHERQESIVKDTFPNSKAEKVNNFNSSCFIEDESGFSSMSSFQEIGIPIINVIPPSPCKDMGYLEDIPDIIDDVDKWKNTIEIQKQPMKVFWV